VNQHTCNIKNEKHLKSLTACFTISIIRRKYAKSANKSYENQIIFTYLFVFI